MTHAPIRREAALFRCPFCEQPHADWQRVNGVKAWTPFYVVHFNGDTETVYCRSCKGELYRGPVRANREVQ